MALKQVELDPELVQVAIVDGINTFVSDVLEYRGLLSEDGVNAWGRGDLDRIKYEVAAETAEKYRLVLRSDKGD